MRRRVISALVGVVTALVMIVALGVPARAASQTCRNIDYATGSTWLRVCLTYTWSSSGATYAVNELRAWNPPNTGVTGIDGTLRQYDNSPFVTLDKDFALFDNQTSLIGDVGIQPSASKFQGVQHRGPGGVTNCLLISPSGNTNRSGTCDANGVP